MQLPEFLKLELSFALIDYLFALPDTLLEDELFGHERGAFTSAEARREGLIAHAEKGTLFLDEVDTLARKAQVDLLRVLHRLIREAGGW